VALLVVWALLTDDRLSEDRKANAARGSGVMFASLIADESKHTGAEPHKERYLAVHESPREAALARDDTVEPTPEPGRIETSRSQARRGLWGRRLQDSGQTRGSNRTDEQERARTLNALNSLEFELNTRSNGDATRAENLACEFHFAGAAPGGYQLVKGTRSCDKLIASLMAPIHLRLSSIPESARGIVVLRYERDAGWTVRPASTQ